MAKIRAEIRQPVRLSAAVKEVHILQGQEPYTGNYTVIPKANGETVLPTKNKQLVHDIRVQKIPYYDVTNAAGGSTVYIAKEI